MRLGSTGQCHAAIFGVEVAQFGFATGWRRVVGTPHHPHQWLHRCEKDVGFREILVAESCLRCS